MNANERSPLKDKPLRLPGQSLDEERKKLIEDKVEPWLLMALSFVVLAGWEWCREVFHWASSAWVVTLAALGMVAFAAFRLARLRGRLRNLRQGAEGERAVGQFLDRLAERGYRVFHDVVGVGFNIDHVMVSPAGVLAIETKTWSKPSGRDARVVCNGEDIKVGGMTPERNPIVQAKAGAAWLRQLLSDSTGKRVDVHPVVLFPGWFVEQDSAGRRLAWVLEPKALPSFLDNEPLRLNAEDLNLIAFHLGRFIRANEADREPNR
jgi:hypothetical protein